MKPYPSIPRYSPLYNGIDSHVFLKYDGSNIRAEWSKKKGWYKFGTRNYLLSEDNTELGEAINLFKELMANDLEAVLRAEWSKVESFLVFFEYFGELSFAGHHAKSDAKHLRLFDINPHQHGIVGPEKFIELFHDKPYMAKYLGQYTINENFVNDVKNGVFSQDGQYEGVVCKWGDRHGLYMMKIKSQQYLNDLKLRFKEDWEKYS